MARYCFSLAKKFSIRWRALYKSRSYGRGFLRLALGGITAALPARASGRSPPPSAEHPLLGVERLVGDQRVRGQVRQQRVRALQVVRLSRREREPGRVAERVDGGVDLGAQPAPAAPARVVPPAAFLTAPALCWWARTTVLSIIAYSLSASPARRSKT